MQRLRIQSMLCHLTMLLGCGALCASPASAADLHVGSGQTYATITDAQTAAVSGVDRIVVHDGTYDELPMGGGGINGWVWDKDVDIVAAPGAHPIFSCTPTAYSYGLLSLTGGNSASVRTWDGIDIKITQYNYSMGQIYQSGYTGTVSFKNTKIYDTGATSISPGAALYFTASVNLNLENVTLDSEQTPVFGLLLDGGTSNVNIDGCNFVGRLNAAIYSRGGSGHRVDITDTTFDVNRAPYVASGKFIRQATGVLNATDCRFIARGGVIGTSAGYSGIFDTLTWVPGTSGPTSTTMTRCLFDTRLGGNWAIDLAATESNNNFKAVNCIFVDDSQIGAAASGRTPFMIRNTTAAGNTTAQFDQCTFSNVSTTETLRPIQVAAANVNTLNLVLRNNLFHIPGSIRGAVSTSSVNGNTSGTINITAGTNLRWTNGAAVGVREKLTSGVIITDNPNLGPDLYSLVDPSAAVNVGEDLGIVDDFDGTSRPLPTGSLPELGAIETYLVPIEVSEFSVD